MIILIIFAAIGIVLFGYLIMSWLDAFFQKGGFIDSPAAKMEKSLLLYCAKQAEQLLDRLEPLLQQQGLRYCLIPEPHVPLPASILAVLAISDNDLDNLLLCHEAKHLHADVYTIALCNDPLFTDFFKDAGIDQVLTGNQPADALVTLISDQISVLLQRVWSTQGREDQKCGS
ncbi:MAG: NAD-binding protein [Bacillota bacterium]|nr:NAD-binding protein [Bacillota bacterium]